MKKGYEIVFAFFRGRYQRTTQEWTLRIITVKYRDHSYGLLRKVKITYAKMNNVVTSQIFLPQALFRKIPIADTIKKIPVTEKVRNEINNKCCVLFTCSIVLLVKC